MATLGIDLSALSPAELQRLLESARARGESELAQHLVAELGYRRAQPQVEMREIRGPSAEAAATPLPEPARTRRHPLPLLLLVVAIAVASATFGWWLRQESGRPAERPVATQPANPPSVASQPAAPIAAPPPLAKPAQASPVAETKPSPVARDRPARAQSAAKAPPRSGLNCSKTRDRADRMVCASADLSLRHRRMRAAYDRALAAGADRLTIDRGQAQWREQRAKATTRSAMANLYIQRTRALEAAAGQAMKKAR